MSEIRKFFLVAVIVCVAVGSFTSYMLYGEDWRQASVWAKAIACDPGTDDVVLYGLGAVGVELLKNFAVASLLAAGIMWLVATRARLWAAVWIGLLATVVACDISKAWMFPIVVGGGFGVLINVGVYGWNDAVGKCRKRSGAKLV